MLSHFLRSIGCPQARMDQMLDMPNPKEAYLKAIEGLRKLLMDKMGTTAKTKKSTEQKRSKKKLLTELAQVEKTHTKKKLELLQVAGKKRVLKEQLRSLTREEVRKIKKQGKGGAVGKKKGGKGKGGAVEKKKGGKAKAGRPSRWPGRCRACCYRHLGLAGGPGHERRLCGETKAWLAKQGRRLV